MQIAQQLVEAKEQLEQRLQQRLAIMVETVKAPLLNHISAINLPDSPIAKQQFVGQFRDCIENYKALLLQHHCLKAVSHQFATDSVALINRVMIKTVIELLLSSDELVAVEIHDWNKALFESFTITPEGTLQPLQHPFIPPDETQELSREIIDGEYLGSVHLFYQTKTLKEIERQGEQSIADFIDQSERLFAETRQRMLRSRLLEVVIFFIVTVAAMFTISLLTIVRPFKAAHRPCRQVS
ncbi:hypothetical protein D5085_18140 [Ectothiorhodospiraceae bacterium BW-2]|nr:hypothetical protein D5085_18140 [Ectothiorhodospiraceae bacterium BW-2]